MLNDKIMVKCVDWCKLTTGQQVQIYPKIHISHTYSNTVIQYRNGSQVSNNNNNNNNNNTPLYNTVITLTCLLNEIYFQSTHNKVPKWLKTTKTSAFALYVTRHLYINQSSTITPVYQPLKLQKHYMRYQNNKHKLSFEIVLFTSKGKHRADTLKYSISLAR